ncbi:MAG: adenylate/guanylate cyclase domain-containing protein [Reyranella sp.]|uniref:adenylate/guanylate cyclase domain-containing protein n=1 Tax=Reyranella sp. TaxID=1929291 RepID=UPI003D0DC475
MTARYATLCKGCWQQMHMPVPLSGVLAAPLRAFGIRRSKMNPNLCTICEIMFERTMKARSITLEATILFADLRSYTKLSQSMSAEAMTGVLDSFYDTCAAAIWRHDGLLNKTIGDAVMAIFNFPVRHADHARHAVLAAREMQEAFAATRAEFAAADTEFGVGIGIDTGKLAFGEFGRSHRDLTAIGTVVNTAARSQSAAKPGQILVTRSVLEAAQADIDASKAADYELKGFDTPVTLYEA